MSSTTARAVPYRGWVTDKIFLGMSAGDYVKSLLTPGTLVASVIMVVGVGLIIYRFVAGLGATTNLSQTSPWGIWIGFDMLSGVALAAGGYTIATSVYIFGLKEYHAIVRPAVLTGFLGYTFAILGLCADLGRPWNLPVPLFVSYGGPSVMFEIAWCVALYASVLAMEFLPPVFEWLGWKRARALAVKATIGLTVFGVMLSTLHQSSLGALFLMTPTKLHPLWYSPFIPAYFFISSIAAGLSMVIVESALSHRAFKSRTDHHVDLDKIAIGLARGASIVLFSYFFVKLVRRGRQHADGPAVHRLRLLVHGRDAGLHPAALAPVRHRGAPRPGHVDSLDGRVDGARHHRQSSQRVRHRIQLGRTGSVRPELDGSMGVDLARHHRHSGVPVDREPHARVARILRVSRVLVPQQRHEETVHDSA